jgi:DNA replicative helicase MCM subunit Mcm2 (Cdc46/Mcm family)
LGITGSEIVASTNDNDPDGGIDASVNNTTEKGSGSIHLGRNGYQIKAGENFYPTEATFKSELFGRGNSADKEHLKSAIKRLMEDDGTYWILAFQREFNDQQRSDAKQICEGLFRGCGYANPKVVVLGQSDIADLLSRYTSLVLLFRPSDSRFRRHVEWSGVAAFDGDFVMGDLQKTVIDGIRKELSEAGDQAIHIRLIGEPGLGKSRLVHEATSTDEYAPLVVYGTGSDFQGSELLRRLEDSANQVRAILVIDECDSDVAAAIWRQLKGAGSRIRIISISNDWEQYSGDTKYFLMPPLGDEEIRRILMGYQMQSEIALKWSDLCDGFPRVAHVIGLNLQRFPDDVFREPDIGRVWNRYIAGDLDPNSAEASQRRMVLRELSLFKKFGYTKNFKGEFSFLAKRIHTLDPLLTEAKQREIIRVFQQRKVLQGEATLYITPKAVQIILWLEWWDMNADAFDPDQFTEGMPPQLVEWFKRMFEYAGGSEACKKVVSKLLSADGPFSGSDFLNARKESDFFFTLSMIDPDSAIDILEKTIGTWSIEQLKNLHEGRRGVIDTLENAAKWGRLFPRAFKLLTRLALAENESYANNSSGILTDLFANGAGEIAPTELPPIERLVYLESLIFSPNSEERRLGIEAAKTALKVDGFVRFLNSRFALVQPKPQLWRPKTRQEHIDAFLNVVRLLNRAAADLPDETEAKKVSFVFVDELPILVLHLEISEELIPMYRDLYLKNRLEKQQLLREIGSLLHYYSKEIKPEVLESWVAFKNELTGSEYKDRLERYATMDVMEEEFGDDGKLLNVIEQRIGELADQSLKEYREEFLSYLDRLIKAESINTNRFGNKLGQKDEDFSFLKAILEAQKRSSYKGDPCLLGSYLSAMADRDIGKYETVMTELAEDDVMAALVPQLVWRARLTDRCADILIVLGQKSKIEIRLFKLFESGGTLRLINEETFQKIVRYLLSRHEMESSSIALGLLHTYYFYIDKTKTIPEDIGYETLIAMLDPGKENLSPYRSRDDYEWTEIAKEYIDLYAAKRSALLEEIVNGFGKDGTPLSGFISRSHDVLTNLAKFMPKEVWHTVTRRLGPPIDSISYHLSHWLRGEGGFSREIYRPISLFSVDDVFNWVEEDVEKRAWYIASFVPNYFFRTEGQVCWAREVLARYGNREDVRRNMAANFSTEGYSGPASMHYEARKKELLDFDKDETDRNVKNWIYEYVKYLDERIESERLDEERDDF